MNAELDAELYLADPKNAAELTKMALEQTTGFSEKALWMALYGQYPEAQGGTTVRNSFPYALTPATIDLIGRSSVFLFSIKSINVDKLRPEAVMPEFAEAALKERGVKSPIGEVKALPASEYKGKM
jgi:NitT/TauT family transport system substrate-binding protein